MQGWISLHRQLTKKAIWQHSTPEHKVILITLLLMANHREKEWEWNGKEFKAVGGQFVTSIDSIKREAGKGISFQNVRSALKRFEKLEFLTNESTKTGRLITIVNWAQYQDTTKESNKADNKEVTKSQQSTNKEPTTNNNDNNDNKKEHIVLFENLWLAYPKKRGKGQVSETQKKKLLKVGAKQLERCIARYVKEMSGRDEQYMQNGSTFFNTGYVDYTDENFNQKQETTETRLGVIESDSDLGPREEVWM